jgi:phage tail sheath protein FI
MPEYLAPAVYVEETETIKPIEGVSTSTAAVLGVTERGPANWPILITSFGEFQRWFGDYLDPQAFPNNRCFLPHAVEGFFTNGGQRVYVTRVVSANAVPSTLDLFDRGTAASVMSALLRSALRNTGTAVQPPLISVIDPGALAANDWIRIGDGSQSEYRSIVGLNPSTQVPLNYPLALAHALNAPIIQFNADPVVGGGYTLAAPAVAGSHNIVVTGANFAPLVADVLLEVDVAASGEHHFVQAVTGTGVNRTVTLRTALRSDYPTIGTVVTALNYPRPFPAPPSVAPLGPLTATTLLASAAAEDTVIFGANLAGAFAPGTLVALEPNTANEEVRRVGTLNRVTLSRPAYRDYAAGSRMDLFALQDDDVTITTANPLNGLSTLALSSVAGLAAGQSVVAGPGTADTETRTIQSVDVTTTSVVLTAPLGNPHTPPPAAKLILSPVPKVLTSPGRAGSAVVSLNERFGLAVGDVIRIGAAPNDEYLTVTALPGAPGPGDVALDGALAIAHGVGTEVRRQIVAPAAAAPFPAFLAVDAPAGSADLFVTDNNAFNVGAVVQVRSSGGVNDYHVIAANAAPVAPQEIELNAPLDRNHEAGAIVAQRTGLIHVEALDTGGWGNRLRISVWDEPDGVARGARLTAINNPTEIVLSSFAGVETGSVLEVSDPSQNGAVIAPLLKVIGVNRSNGRISLDPATQVSALQIAADLANPGTLQVRSREFRLSVVVMRAPDPLVPAREEVQTSEFFPNLSMDPRHSRYFQRVIGVIGGLPLRAADHRPEGESWYVRVQDLEVVQASREAIRLGPEALTDTLPSGRTAPARHALDGGSDAIGLLAIPDFIGLNPPDPEQRTGLQTFRNMEDVSLVSAPGQVNPALQDALISHCEELRYRFAVLDGPPPPDDSIADVRNQRQQFDTKYAALYHPWLLIPQPFPASPAAVGQPYPVPPSGHVLGVFARTDSERGVHKAPANEVVRGIIGLQRLLNKQEQDILNPYPVNINVIRDFRPNNRGIRIWGGRVITSDSAWKYVNVRRLLIFIEHSIDRGLQWVVFEPNAEPLWARVRRTISNFLTIVWRNGGLEGTKVEEAYFVKCDRTTMTQTEIDNGQLICVIGVAPVKPAEFVIIRIGLWTARSDS